LWKIEDCNQTVNHGYCWAILGKLRLLEN
jgi:hypothetical protein